MPKDKKAKEAAKKQRVAAKQEKKSTKKEKKAAHKSKNDPNDTDNEDVDIDTVLAEYAKQQEQYHAISETASPPPAARSSSTILANPASANELFLFGGEYFNGSLARFFNELFVYNVKHDTWKAVTSPNSPLPRSGHAWTVHGNSKMVYLFGGEFSSPKQGTFYHYNDFWNLNPTSREWSKLESKKGAAPPARSGHRMTHFKQYIVLFGGFQDTAMATKYLNDLWLYDTSTFTWHSPALPPASQKPEARSSFSLLPHEGGAVLYGGYSRVKSTATKTASSRPGKGGPQHQQTVLKPMVHQDAWFLRITPPAQTSPQNTPPTVRWERRKRPTNAPNPSRAGATMAYHKGRGIQFGGVHDVEASEEGIDSEFFNQLNVWNIERNRYFSLALRRPRQSQKNKGQIGESNKSRKAGGRAKADEEELLRNLAELEKNTSGAATKDTDTESTAAGSVLSGTTVGGDEDGDDSEEETKIEKPTLWEFPHPRFNAQLTVQDDVLYIYGGTFEKGDREYTFDEMFAIDLGKLDGVREIFKREQEDWVESDEDEDDEDEDGKDDDDDEEEDEKDEDQESVLAKEDDKVINASSRGELEPVNPVIELSVELEETRFDDEASVEVSPLTDNLPHPRPFESLREFFARTSQTWQEILLEDWKREGVAGSANRSIKEMRKGAFDRAEEKWWDCREDIQALEDEQEAAGIGEVISLNEKAAQGSVSGAGRRR